MTTGKGLTLIGPGPDAAFSVRGLVVAVVGTAVLLGLTHIPRAEMPEVLQAGGLDKVEHVVAYGLVAMGFLLSVRRSAPRWVFLAVVLALMGVSALDELTQPLVHRTCDIWDYASDVAGIALACLVLVTLRVRRG